MDAKSLRTLEFDKVLTRLAEYTNFSAGEELALATVPTTNTEQARRWQAETAEAAVMFTGDNTISIGGTKDVRRATENAQRGFTLSAEDFAQIKGTLSSSRTLKRNLLKAPEIRPHLVEIAELVEEIPGLIDLITKTIDDRGEVLDSASDKLGKLRTQLRVSHGRIQEKLRTLLNSSHNQYLQEPLITMRGGRYVVPLRAEFKGRIKGIIHDQSSSGATLYVEPLNTVELNNDYRGYQIDEEKEIERILSKLSAEVAIHGEIIIRIVERMAELDVIFARARYAMQTDSVKPIFVDWRKATHPHPGSTIWLRGARHPLLDPGEVIPTDVLVEDDIFTVLITGPNTGGKTVVLKNIGLMVLMAQSGLHVPANEARLSVFKNVFSDIGDEQSIEQSLSTFSAHITNIVHVLDGVDDRSLVVFDELGSGTDPTEGAAIAQSIINFLRDKGATSFIATHYPELKLYASQTEGATNASMIFDVDTLSPTYEMAIGIPGKSNALAIARRLGLNESVLDEAMNLVGVGSQEAESLIDSIFDLREKISAEEAATRLALKSAEKERDLLSLEVAGLEYDRHRILEDARKEGEKELASLREEIRKARRTLRDAQSITSVKKLSKQVSELEDNLEKPIPSATESGAIVISEPARRRNRRLIKGDNVLIKALNTKGTITSIRGKEAEIAAGRLKMKVRLDQLEYRGRDEPEKREAPLPRAPIVSDLALELDLRGERVDSGLERLDQYLDAATYSDLPFARIIHGKGSGRMRDAVRRALREHNAVKKWEEAKDNEGGTGVTIVRFKS